MIGTLETGQVFLDTREVNVPIRWEWGITGPYIPEGLEEGLAGARAGGRRLIVVPAELGYGSSGIRLPQVHLLPLTVHFSCLRPFLYSSHPFLPSSPPR